MHSSCGIRYIFSWTCLVDLYAAAVSYFLNEAQQRRLKIAQAGVLIFGPDVVNPYGSARQRGQHQPLPEVLAALEAQHLCRLSQSGDHIDQWEGQLC